MKFGSFDLSLISDGNIWLDGGGMFGIVPKPLWSKIIEHDDHNRVPLDTTSLLIQTDEATILVETGIGDHYSEKQHHIYKFNFERRLLQGLAETGVSPEKIDIVIQSHLHFDHCGALMLADGKGGYEPAFPNAEVVVQRGEREAALNPDVRSKASYFEPAFYQALEEKNKLRLVEGTEQIIPGVSVSQRGGHTVHHQIVEVEQGGKKVIFVGDFIPMTRHINIAYSMGFDMLPIKTSEDKVDFLPKAHSEEDIIVFVHDPDTPAARIVKEGRKWGSEKVEDFYWVNAR